MWLMQKILEFFKLESTREMEKNADNSTNRNEMSISEAYMKIDRANKLADIANKTINREEFYNSINEIEDILTELSKHEHQFNFSYRPSANLRDLRRGRNKQIKLLEKRIAQKEKEVASARNKVNKKIEPIYHSRIDKEYCELNNYREIKFNGRNFDISEVKLCAAILLTGNQKGSKIRSDDQYSLYFKERYGITNISMLHMWLYEQGYLREARPSEALSLYKVQELKNILESFGLKKTGNKSDLIERVINVLDDGEKERIANRCEYLFVAEKGYAFLKENSDYVMWHKKSYGVTFEEFNKHRILQGKKRKFYDTIFQALSEKAYMYQIKQYFSQLEMIYHNLSEVCYDEAKSSKNSEEKMYTLSLQYALFRLYFSTNLASKSYLFSLEHVKFEGIKAIKNKIMTSETFNPYIISRVIELKPFFREEMLDVIYNLGILPYCLFGKYDMLDVVQDLYDNTFNEELYMKYIRANYGNYIKKYL